MKFYKNIKINTVLASFACLAFGMFSGYISHAGNTTWYQSLLKPTYNPPSWIFSPVWTILYIMLGAAGAKLWNLRKTHPQIFNLFLIQMLLNYSWSPAFFYLHKINLALAIAVIMWILTLLIINQLKRIKETIIIKLLLPYFGWISFALLLNFKMAQLNP